MPEPTSSSTDAPEPEGLDDPRALQILNTEHWSLLSQRSLAYNEAFTRAGMFLAFLSMSFVGLALLSQGMAFDRTFLAISAVVLAFDIIIGLATFFRVAGCNFDDLRAMHGMNRIRHAYVEMAPAVAPYFITGYHDDPASVYRNYGFATLERSALQDLGHGLATTIGMVELIVSLLTGVLVVVVALALDAPFWIAIAVAVVTMCVVLATAMRWVMVHASHVAAELPVLFPAPDEPA
ncbi:MAG: hypothetical protein ABI534_10120 [Chloroflexota bacterium]